MKAFLPKRLIHVRSADGEAKISLTSPFAVSVNAGFSASELRKIQRLVAGHQTVLLGLFMTISPKKVWFDENSMWVEL